MEKKRGGIVEIVVFTLILAALAWPRHTTYVLHISGSESDPGMKVVETFLNRVIRDRLLPEEKELTNDPTFPVLVRSLQTHPGAVSVQDFLPIVGDYRQGSTCYIVELLGNDKRTPILSFMIEFNQQGEATRLFPIRDRSKPAIPTNPEISV